MFNSPFSQAGAGKIATKGLLRGSKLSFNGIVTNLEKTVSTINQVVPLYNQVKPLIANSKTLINAFRSTKTSDKKSKRGKRVVFNNANTNPDIINVEINKPTFSSPLKQETITNNNYQVFNDTTTPNKPFFI